MIWSLDTDQDSLTWIHVPADVPTTCICCGTALDVTDRSAKDGRAIELQCDRGHRWQETLQLLERRIEALSKPPPDPPRLTPR